MTRDLGPAAVAERFRDIFVSEESGSLIVRSGPKVYAVHFTQGLIVGAEGGQQPSESSLAAGMVSSKALAEARQSASEGQDPGPVLVARGTSTVESVADSAANLANEVIDLAFACIPDELDFRPSPVSAGESGGDILRTVEAFFSGVRGMAGFDEIREALSALHHRLLLRSNPAVPLERLALQPIHGFLLSRLDGSLNLKELASTLPPGEETEAARFIFALLLLGSVVLEPPLGPGLFRTELLLTDHIRDAAREQAEIDFVRETYAALQGQNPYQMLCVKETAEPKEIQRAYGERKQAVGSDRFLESVRERMSAELRIIDARLTEAYLALQSGDAPRAAGRDQEEAPALNMDALALRREVTKTEVAVTLDEKEKLAEQYYLTAKKYFSQADYHNCVQYCTLAIRQSDQTARYHFLLGEAQSRNPDHRWQKNAERSFLRATKLDPWSADYLVVLGQLYKRQGLKVRARRQFERALELQPGHPRAAEELRLTG